MADSLKDLYARIDELVQRLAPFCSFISVRHDERGPFVLAVGRDAVHSLELWHQGGEFIVELWRGRNAEDGQVVDTRRCREHTAALHCAAQWLHPDHA